MHRNKIIIGLVLIVIGTLLFVVSDEGKNPHHGKPTPTPTATPIPQITLAWDASNGATGYKFKLGFVSGGENQVTDVGNVLVYTIQLTSGTTYYFVVTAYNSNGESLPSNEVSYTVP